MGAIFGKFNLIFLKASVADENLLSSVGSDSERLHLNTANTMAIGLSSELDVALVTPGGVPRVLDKPVVKASVSIVAEANDEHGVVEFRTTP